MGVGVGVALVVACAAGACVLWCRWVYRQGHRQYWARVRREQMLASGITDKQISPRDYSETDAILWNTK